MCTADRVLHVALVWLSEQGIDVDPADILTWRVYPDNVAMVVNPGYKYVVPRPIIIPVSATPAARRLAEENGLNICIVVGTGKDGRITVADVTEAGR